MRTCLYCGRAARRTLCDQCYVEIERHPVHFTPTRVWNEALTFGICIVGVVGVMILKVVLS